MKAGPGATVWEKLAARAAGVLGTGISIHTAKDRRRFGKMIDDAGMQVPLGAFAALAALSLLLGLGGGALFVFSLLSYAGIAGPLVSAMMFSPIVGLIAFFVGYRAPAMAYKARVADIERNLTYFIPFVASTVASGVPIELAFSYGAEGRNFGTLSDELGRVLRQYEIGKDMFKALYSSRARVASPTYSRFLTHLTYAMRVGVAERAVADPREHPLAKALMALSAKTEETFSSECRSYFQRLEPILSIPQVLLILLPLMILVLYAVAQASGLPFPVSPAAIRLLYVAIVPFVTMMFFLFIAIKEPR